MRHVVFRLGAERYGLALAAVREVVEPSTVSRAPRAPSTVLGIMNLRGRVVTVIDLARLLGLEPRAGTAAASSSEPPAPAREPSGSAAASRAGAAAGRRPLDAPTRPAAGAVPAGKVVLLDRARRDLGLLVSAVDGILDLEEITVAPGEAQPSVRGVARVQGSAATAVTVLDAEGLERQVVGQFKPTR